MTGKRSNEDSGAKRPGRGESKNSGSRLPDPGRVDWDALEEDPTPHFEKSSWKSSRRRKILDERAGSRGRRSARTQAEPALVLSVGAKRCTADHGGERRDCRLPSSLAARQRFALAVGDLVELTQERGAWWVTGVLPRRTELARVDPRDPRCRKVIAANIDLVVVVAGMAEPGLNTGLLDRYLLAVEQCGAEVLLCINKIDLSPDDSAEEWGALEPYRQLGHRILPCSAATGQGIGELLAELRGKTCVLVGHSGVGKSSLLNALQPQLRLAAKPVRRADGTGRHTTTRSNLYRLEGNTRIIDTPGVRELGLWGMSGDEIRRSFPELSQAAEGCRFTNCTHTHEPDCAVKGAVTEGSIPQARYDAYRRILASVE